MNDNDEPQAPECFRAAVESMKAARVRSEISTTSIRPPKNLAPFADGVGFEVVQPDIDVIPELSGGDAFGRLILLHDPGSGETPDGTMRLVAYIQADMESSLAQDPLLPQVTWQWLREGMEETQARFENLGGTVTCTSSVRYGDMEDPEEAFQLELRASWTATGCDLGAHAEAFATVLAHVAGLPPEGIATLGSVGR